MLLNISGNKGIMWKMAKPHFRKRGRRHMVESWYWWGESASPIIEALV